MAASGYVLETNDGGATWQAKRGGGNSLFAVAAPAGHPAVAAGLLGTVAHENNGSNWVVDEGVSSRVYTWLRSAVVFARRLARHYDRRQWRRCWSRTTAARPGTR